MGSNLGTVGRTDPKFTRHLDDLYPTLEGLFDAAEAVEDMLAHPGWAHLTRLLEAEAAEADVEVDGRLLESRAEYAFAHGRRGGLRSAMVAASTLLRRAESKLAEQRAKHENVEPRVLAGERG